MPTDNPNVISAASLVSERTGEPLVEIILGGEKCQMPVDDARTHALNIIEAAEAAQSDAFMLQFLTKSFGDADGTKFNQVVRQEFIKYRNARKQSGAFKTQSQRAPLSGDDLLGRRK